MKLLPKMVPFVALVFILSGCSMHNPFGVGYDSSVCSQSKTFGVCGAPKDVYKYRDKIRKVQSDYLKAHLDTTLYFSITPEGVIQVKADRNAPWETYNTSAWKKLIEERLKRGKEKEAKERKASVSVEGSYEVLDDKSDLSVAYNKQNKAIYSRTRIGNIIRDNGYIQEAMIFNYVDRNNDLIASHNVFVVVREPDWIIGEKTPKHVKIEDFPTPMSSDMLKKQQRIEKSQEDTIRKFNRNEEEGYASAQEYEAKSKKSDKLLDLNLIENFIQDKSNKGE